jgi:hypothetical protein
MKRKILEQVLSQSPTGPLYHYTNQRGFMGIVEDTEIWATHTQYLNDWREYSHAVDMVRDQIRATRAFGNRDLHSILRDMEKGLDGIESMNVCVCSFSQERDSLSQWRAYGGHSSSFSIGFDGAFLAEVAAKEQWYLVPCIYDAKVQGELVSALVLEVIEENVAREALGKTEEVMLPPGGNLNAYLHRYAPILKDYSFRDEREWRLISRPLNCRSEAFFFREGTSMLIPFYKFPLIDSERHFRLHEIVVGPTPHPQQATMSARGFLVKNFQRDVPVELSTVPYRSW